MSNLDFGELLLEEDADQNAPYLGLTALMPARMLPGA
jgi:hypothetical protein